MPIEKRPRGGQPGNHNALKHGFYSREFKKKAQYDFDLASGVGGIDEEIALLRCEIKNAVSGKDVSSLVPIVKATLALEKLLRTRHKIFGAQNKLEGGVRKIFREILMPIGGIDLVRGLAHFEYPDEFPPFPPTVQDQKTDNPQNETGSPPEGQLP
jgi:hypothetical protein